MREQVISARRVVKARGLDNGPWSIYYYLIDDIGMDPAPSRSTIASIIAEAGLVDANARKRPRSSYRRFARDKAGQLWQIDPLVYRLFDMAHTQVTIYQIIDDATRLDTGTRAFAAAENGADAKAALAAAFKAYGKPREVLSDNGEAFATYHRGKLSHTQVWLASLGVMPIAGFAPTTQGKDERARATLVKWLDARTPRTLAEVNEHIEAFREHYNTRRRHRSLLVGTMHITPAQAWET